MDGSVFRKASLDRVSSPEQLNDYIKVSTPSIWLVIAAAGILLAALFVWAVAGRIPAGEAGEAVRPISFLLN